MFKLIDDFLNVTLLGVLGLVVFGFLMLFVFGIFSVIFG